MENLDFFTQNGWEIHHRLEVSGREAQRFPFDDLDFAPTVLTFLRRAYPQGIFQHQKIALNAYLKGESVCLTTGTASGKSLVFQSAALDCLTRDSAACVMAIYPMKALGTEQKDRWEQAFQLAGMDVSVGRIDGNVAPALRLGILEKSRLLIFTPDILHAWLLSNLNQPAVIRFLRRVRLMVVDEVHTYSGVFGSNSAFLFRRLRHLMGLLDAHPRFIAASATIARPQEHLQALFGVPFQVVGPEVDTSPRFPLEVLFAQPPTARSLDPVVSLLHHLAQETDSRFIAFVNSRKQVELISSLLSRMHREESKPVRESKEKAKDEAEEEEDESLSAARAVLEQLQVLPYRAGYEEHDRAFIQERLSSGNLKGVISTSALELGLDIPHLDLCVLIGVPDSATSLQQRIGRIGRHKPGTVILVHGGDVVDHLVFADPPSLFHRPFAESTLYLENPYMQYIHALCLARPGGEHTQVLMATHRTSDTFNSVIEWPPGFMELCRAEYTGNTPRELLSMKNEAKDRPNYAFPLREVGSQFKVERAQGPTSASLGSLSFSQLMREAYPGAVYYYASVPYRVVRVNIKQHTVQVRREKHYTTRPGRLPEALFPRLTAEGVLQAQQRGGLIALEAQTMVRESINGLYEQRGGKETFYSYPLPRELGFSHDQPFFSHNYFTSGVLISHPLLQQEGVNHQTLAGWLYEAFFVILPMERQEIGFSADTFRHALKPFIQPGQPFLAVYDQVYGSLRLSSRLLAPQVLPRVLLEACLLTAEDALAEDLLATRKVLAHMTAEAWLTPLQALRLIRRETPTPAGKERILLPGSKGLLMRTHEEFLVQRLVTFGGNLCYEGVPASMAASAASSMPQVIDVAEIPGESQIGWYDPITQTIEPAPVETVQLSAEEGDILPPPDISLLLQRLSVGQTVPPPDSAALTSVDALRDYLIALSG